MTNTSGGYLVLGVDEHKSGDHLLGFKLVGFDVGIEDNVENQIRNEMVKIEPYTDVAIKNIEDDNKKKFYPILKIESDDFKKPYLTRGICYVRLGPSSTRASRTTILNLFTNLSERRENVDTLRNASNLLKEALTYSAKTIRDSENTPALKIVPVDLSVIKSCALATVWFFKKYELLGGNITMHSSAGGLYSFLHDMEELNLYIGDYNRQSDNEKKKEIRDRVHYWGAENDSYRKAVGFLENVNSRTNEFLSNY